MPQANTSRKKWTGASGPEMRRSEETTKDTKSKKKTRDPLLMHV
jgi:hypothetical protein